MSVTLVLKHILRNIKLQKFVMVIAMLFTVVKSYATEFLVKDATEIAKVAQSIQPGDSIVMKDGVWTDQYVQFKGIGKEKAPIVLRAQTPGKVILNGKSHLDISGQWLTVDGLRFENGALEIGQHIVRFTGKAGECLQCRFTNSAIINYNPKDQKTRYFWVSLYGKNNRVDHNRFEGQNHSGVTVVVWKKSNLVEEHLIEYNYFLNRPVSLMNGFESIRIGGGDKIGDSKSTVQFNLFEKTDSDLEVISIKSGNNVVRFNTLLNAMGTITLRNGNGSHVTDNIFIGNGLKGTGGIRVMGENHTIANNYLQDLDSPGGAGIILNCGNPVGHQIINSSVRNVLISNNTLVNISKSGFRTNVSCGTLDRSVQPVKITLINNLVSGTTPAFLDGYKDDSWIVKNNLFFGSQEKGWSKEFGIHSDPLLKPDTNGFWRPDVKSPVIKAGLPIDSIKEIDDAKLSSHNLDIGADVVYSERSLHAPLSAKDVGPIWMQ